MAVANGMRSVANARPTLFVMLPNELDTDIPAKPHRSISRAVSSVARRRPGSAIRLRVSKAVGMGRGSFSARKPPGYTLENGFDRLTIGVHLSCDGGLSGKSIIGFGQGCVSFPARSITTW